MKLLVGGSFRVRRLLGMLFVLSVVTAACGEGKADDPTAEDTPRAEAGAGDDAATSPTTSAASKKSGGTSPSKGATPTTTTAGGSSAPAKTASEPSEQQAPARTLEIKAELQESCVRPGGTQTVTVRTLANAGVGFDTQYADNLTGMEPGHYGGNNAGFTDEDGTWASTWTVAPNAPAGETTVLVLGTHETGGNGETKALFKVADSLGKCS